MPNQDQSTVWWVMLRRSESVVIVVVVGDIGPVAGYIRVTRPSQKTDARYTILFHIFGRRTGVGEPQQHLRRHLCAYRAAGPLMCSKLVNGQ